MQYEIIVLTETGNIHTFSNEAELSNFLTMRSNGNFFIVENYHSFAVLERYQVEKGKINLIDAKKV